MHILRPDKILDTYTPVFTAALFPIAWTLKQPKCPSTEERIKKMRYTYTMEYYTVITKNEIMLFAATGMDLEIVMLSKVSQRKINISFICAIYYKNIINQLIYKTGVTDVESKLVVTKGERGAGRITGRLLLTYTHHHI